MTRRFVLSSFAALVCLSVAGSTAWADHRTDPHDKIQQKAASLSSHSLELYYEIREDYRGEPSAVRVMSEVLDLYRSARRMSGYAAAHSRFSTMEREMSRLETEFHQVKDSLGGLSHYYGHHRHLRELVRCIDDLVDDIHVHLHDLRDRDFFSYDEYRYAPVYSSGLGPDSWYFGGGGFTVRLGR